MSIEDVYSGMDSSGDVPRTLDSIIEKLESGGADQSDVTMLKELAESERDSNWRGFALGLAGLIELQNGRVDPAKQLFLRAIQEYSILERSFLAASNVYCQVCYSLGSILFDDEDYRRAAYFLLKCIPIMWEVYDDLFIGNIFLYLDLCFSFLGESELALAFAEAAVIRSGMDCDSLEALMISLNNCGDSVGAQKVYRIIQNKYSGSPCFERASDFAARRLGRCSADDSSP